jgi:hypothetical protein
LEESRIFRQQAEIIAYNFDFTAEWLNNKFSRNHYFLRLVNEEGLAAS